MVFLIAYILLFLSTALASWIMFIELPKANVDMTRDDLFRIRNRLFDEVVDAKLEFNDPAYKSTRDLLNGLIGNIEKISLTRLCLTHLLAKKLQSSEQLRFRNQFDQELAQLKTDEARKLIRDARDDAHFAVALYVIKGSIVLCNLLVIFYLLRSVRRWVDKAARKFNHSFNKHHHWDSFDSQAMGGTALC